MVQSVMCPKSVLRTCIVTLYWESVSVDMASLTTNMAYVVKFLINSGSYIAIHQHQHYLNQH